MNNDEFPRSYPRPINLYTTADGIHGDSSFTKSRPVLGAGPSSSSSGSGSFLDPSPKTESFNIRRVLVPSTTYTVPPAPPAAPSTPSSSHLPPPPVIKPRLRSQSALVSRPRHSSADGDGFQIYSRMSPNMISATSTFLRTKISAGVRQVPTVNTENIQVVIGRPRKGLHVKTIIENSLRGDNSSPEDVSPSSPPPTPMRSMTVGSMNLDINSSPAPASPPAPAPAEAVEPVPTPSASPRFLLSKSLTMPTLVDDLDGTTPVTQHWSHYIGEIVFQITDYLFIGGLDASQNQNMLCRLNIQFIIDIGGPEADMLAQKRTEVPCLCGTRVPHSRTILAIRIKDDSETGSSQKSEKREIEEARDSRGKLNPVIPYESADAILGYFKEANKYIERARTSNKGVLIYSVQCRNRAPAFAAAHLMAAEKLTRVQAVQRVSSLLYEQLRVPRSCQVPRIRPGLNISDSMMRALMHWQKKQMKLHGYDAANDIELVQELFRARKNAWS